MPPECLVCGRHHWPHCEKPATPVQLPELSLMRFPGHYHEDYVIAAAGEGHLTREQANEIMYRLETWEALKGFVKDGLGAIRGVQKFLADRGYVQADIDEKVKAIEALVQRVEGPRG